jgi:hypothetical protein
MLHSTGYWLMIIVCATHQSGALSLVADIVMIWNA